MCTENAILDSTKKAENRQQEQCNMLKCLRINTKFLCICCCEHLPFSHSDLRFSAGHTALHTRPNGGKAKCHSATLRRGSVGECGATAEGVNKRERREGRHGGGGRKGPRMSPTPPRPLCLTDEFKRDMVIACLQHSPNHKSLCQNKKKEKKMGKQSVGSVCVLVRVSVCVRAPMEENEKGEVKPDNERACKTQ